MEKLSELGNGTVEAETGLKVALKLYKFIRYIELRSLQRIRAARSEGTQTWTFREWKRRLHFNARLRVYKMLKADGTPDFRAGVPWTPTPIHPGDF